MFSPMTHVVEPTAPVSYDHGALDVHANFPSLHLRNERTITVWTPPGYAADLDRRYPVLYMHDGQNLFDPEAAFVPGQIWAADRAALALIADGRIPPIIIVGVYNTGIHRMAEYTPSVDPRLKQGGKADLYGRFLVEELKPFVDRRYRTKRDAASTALGGSSLGGLVTLAIGLDHPTVFGTLLVVSPSVWWDKETIVRRVASLRRRTRQRIWLDMGTREGDGAVEQARRLRDALAARGWSVGRDLRYVEVDGAGHDEASWAARFDDMLEFAFPAR